MPCAASGLPLCAGCKDLHAQAECEKGLLQVLGQRTHELKVLREVQRVQKITHDEETAEFTSSIDEAEWYLEHAQDALNGHNLLLRYTLYH